MVAAFPQSKEPSFRKAPSIRDQGFEDSGALGTRIKWRFDASPRGFTQTITQKMAISVFPKPLPKFTKKRDPECANKSEISFKSWADLLCSDKLAYISLVLYCDYFVTTCRTFDERIIALVPYHR